MKNKKINIAIDGYSSTGKSTVAKKIAHFLGYVYIDTGAMYRAVTLYAYRNGLIGKDFFDKDGLIRSLDAIHLQFRFNNSLGHSEIYLNGENVEDQIRNMEISGLVSKVAAVSEVRKKLVEQQRKMGADKGVVMDGRDIGTKVLPDAELKIFMTASPEKRAQRRYKEMVESGEDVSYLSVLENVTERDRIDTTRSDSPLVKADDAIELDNSNLTAEQTYEQVLKLVKEKL